MGRFLDTTGRKICGSLSDAVYNRFELHPIQPFEYEKDGLGRCTAFIFEIEGSKYWSMSFPDAKGNAQYINISVLSTEPDSLLALEKLISVLGLEKNQLPWINENIGKAGWILIRIDDNGNEAEMFRFQEQSCAEWVRKKYEDKGHKQHYSVRRAE